MVKRLLYLAVAFLAAVTLLPSGFAVKAQDASSYLDIVLDGSKFKITWDAVSGATAYDIYHAGSRLGQYELLDTVTETKYTHNTPNPDKYQNYYKIVAKNGAAQLSEQIISLELKIFGPNVKFYDITYDKISDIEAEINRIHDQEMWIVNGQRAEFTDKRYALYLKPGTYSGYSVFKVGYYTQLAGLGALPTDTKLNGSIRTPSPHGDGRATVTFWRAAENFQITGGTFRWGVSQAAPTRRIKADVSTTFDDGSNASGGFAADCYFGAQVGSYPQQQYYVRNSHFTQTMFGVNWNKVVQGSTGPVEDNNTTGTRTKIEKTPIIREKPFLYLNNGEYKVFVPALRHDAQGLSWSEDDMGQGRSLDLLNDFYVARADKDNADSINKALNRGKHIFFTPGRYILDKPIIITKPNTVVLGAGYATLIPGPNNKYGAIYIDDVEGVTVAGLLLDALYDSKYLLCAGDLKTGENFASNPTFLFDVFLRVGGYSEDPVNADVSALINSNHLVGDHFWIWRADHGSGVAWVCNTGDYGLMVTGSDVTIYGLFVEHYQKYQTLWLGDNGRMYFYQCEFPYDPLNQDAYKSHGGTVDGWAAYKVANSVNNHLAVGLGMYAVFNRTGENRDKSESVFVENAMEVPNKPGVTVINACTVELSSQSGALTGVRSVINGTGGEIYAGNNGGVGTATRRYVTNYTNGTAVTGSPNKTATDPADEEFEIPTDVKPPIGTDAPDNTLLIIILSSAGGALLAGGAVALAVFLFRKKKA